MKNQNMIVACAVTAVVAGAIGFYGNNYYQQNQRNSRFGGTGNGTGLPQNQNGFARGTSGYAQPQMMRNGIVAGEVIAKDDKSITVKLPDGSSKIIILSSNTSYRISNDAKLDDVVVGKTVSVFGTTNADGSTTAASIELNPISFRK